MSEMSGNMDVSLASLGCPTVPVNGSLQTTGTFVANADGTYSDNTTTTGSVTFPLAAFVSHHFASGCPVRQDWYIFSRP